jgi:lipopolysaccharide export system permease protein
MLGLMRLTVDQEIIALKVSGLSYRQLFRPVLSFSVAVAFLTLTLTVFGAPWARRQTQALLTDVVKRRADLGIQEQVFNTEFRGMMIYVNRVVAVGQELEGIFLYDSRDRENTQTIYARRGNLMFDSSRNTLLLGLTEGIIIRWDPAANRRHTVDFNAYRLPLQVLNGEERDKPETEMSLKELKKAMDESPRGSERHNRAAVELGQRFAMPVGALILCFLAMPLGMGQESQNRTFGLVMGLLVFLIYYVVFTASWRLAVNAQLPPLLAPWSANVLFAFLAGYLWHRTVRELPLLNLSSLRGWRRDRSRPGG